jgi:hypothetical protein
MSSGTIKIVLQGLHNIRSCAAGKPQQTAEFGVVPEKALKGQAKTHTARYEPNMIGGLAKSWPLYSLAAPQKTREVSRCEGNNAKSGPFATFCFQYRSLGKLDTASCARFRHLQRRYEHLESYRESQLPCNSESDRRTS